MKQKPRETCRVAAQTCLKRPSDIGDRQVPTNRCHVPFIEITECRTRISPGVFRDHLCSILSHLCCRLRNAWNPHPILFKVSRITTTEDVSNQPGFRTSLTLNASPRSVLPGQHFPNREASIPAGLTRRSILNLFLLVSPWFSCEPQPRGFLADLQLFLQAPRVLNHNPCFLPYQFPLSLGMEFRSPLALPRPFLRLKA